MLGTVHIPFLNLTLKCPVGGRCTVLGETLKKIWIFFSHVLHRLWETMKIIENLVLPLAFPGHFLLWFQTPPPHPGPILLADHPVPHPGLHCWLLPSSRMARRHFQVISVLLKLPSSYQCARWAHWIQQGPRWYMRVCQPLSWGLF